MVSYPVAGATAPGATGEAGVKPDARCCWRSNIQHTQHHVLWWLHWPPRPCDMGQWLSVWQPPKYPQIISHSQKKPCCP